MSLQQNMMSCQSRLQLSDLRDVRRSDFFLLLYIGDFRLRKIIRLSQLLRLLQLSRLSRLSGSRPRRTDTNKKAKKSPRFLISFFACIIPLYRAEAQRFTALKGNANSYQYGACAVRPLDAPLGRHFSVQYRWLGCHKNARECHAELLRNGRKVRKTAQKSPPQVGEAQKTAPFGAVTYILIVSNYAIV